MKLILKYLKPYFLIVLLIIGFTYGQVQSELALPDYMSDIVTNGIQYGGIEENVPKAILEKDLNQLLLFTEEDEKEIVLKNYELKSKDQTYVIDKQEVKFIENTYVLTGTDDLSDILRKPLVYSYLLEEINLLVTSDNADETKLMLEEKLVGLEDNLTSMSKLYISDVYNNVGLNTQKIQSNYILHSGLLMLAISLFSVVVTLLATYFANLVASKVAFNLRKDVFEKVQSFSSYEFSNFSTSSLITRTGNDITKVQSLIQMMLRMMLMSPIMGITAVFKVVKYPSISWVLLVAIGIIVMTMIFLLIVAVPKFEKIQKLVDKVNNIMREVLDGMLVIRAFNSQKIEEEKFDEANTAQTRIDRFISRCMGIASPVMTVVMNVLTIAIIWFASSQIEKEVITIGDTMAFIQYAMHVVMSFMFVTVTFFMVPRSLVSVKRIKEVLDTDLTILDKENPKELPLENGTLEFKDVSFKYPGAEEYVLKDINFKVEPGKTVAIIGSTASGKSTIVKLIPRLFDVSEGEIEYSGIDIRDVKQHDLREKIGYATQKAILFTGTIKSNIEFGRNITKEELNQAINVSQSKNIIDEKEKGLDEKITQGGTNVSGGQKQRLSIARALAKEKSIYIFDDCFSALDYETDKKLRNELNKLIQKTKAIVIIVAQRISTIKNADEILVLEDGKIVGNGTHEQLLDSCKVYQEIAKSQLSDKELKNYARA